MKRKDFFFSATTNSIKLNLLGDERPERLELTMRLFRQHLRSIILLLIPLKLYDFHPRPSQQVVLSKKMVVERDPKHYRRT